MYIQIHLQLVAYLISGQSQPQFDQLVTYSAQLGNRRVVPYCGGNAYRGNFILVATKCEATKGLRTGRNERFHLQVGALAARALGHSLEAAISLLISDGTTEGATPRDPR